MITLIVGDFCTGKDLVADLLVKESLQHNDCEKFVKIKSYTTRDPRYDGEDTHLFCTKDEFLSFNDVVAQTQIGDHFYGTRQSQFKTSKVNLYCIDDKGVADIMASDIDEVFIIEVVRPVWLRDCPQDRLNRKRHNEPYEYTADYRIINDGSMQKLEASVLDCFNYLMKVKKSL